MKETRVRETIPIVESRCRGTQVELLHLIVRQRERDCIIVATLPKRIYKRTSRRPFNSSRGTIERFLSHLSDNPDCQCRARSRTSTNYDAPCLPLAALGSPRLTSPRLSTSSHPSLIPLDSTTNHYCVCVCVCVCVSVCVCVCGVW